MDAKVCDPRQTTSSTPGGLDRCLGFFGFWVSEQELVAFGLRFGYEVHENLPRSIIHRNVVVDVALCVLHIDNVPVKVNQMDWQAEKFSFPACRYLDTVRRFATCACEGR